jgi:hypothetical protein
MSTSKETPNATITNADGSGTTSLVRIPTLETPLPSLKGEGGLLPPPPPPPPPAVHARPASSVHLEPRVHPHPHPYLTTEEELRVIFQDMANEWNAKARRLHTFTDNEPPLIPEVEALPSAPTSNDNQANHASIAKRFILPFRPGPCRLSDYTVTPDGRVISVLDAPKPLRAYGRRRQSSSRIRASSLTMKMSFTDEI